VARNLARIDQVCPDQGPTSRRRKPDLFFDISVAEGDIKGFDERASLIWRSIIEHAVALQGLAAEGDGIFDTDLRCVPF
jgi:hypothetical protein